MEKNMKDRQVWTTDNLKYSPFLHTNNTNTKHASKDTNTKHTSKDTSTKHTSKDTNLHKNRDRDGIRFLTRSANYKAKYPMKRESDDTSFLSGDETDTKLMSKLESSSGKRDPELSSTGVVTPEEKSNLKSIKLSWTAIVRETKFRNQTFSETVCMQGLAPICDPQSSLPRKSFWFAIVTLAIAFTGYNIYKQLSVYLQVPINVRVDYLQASDISFPTVTLCNNNFADYFTAAFLGAVEQVKQTKPLTFQKVSLTPNYTGFNFEPYHQTGWDMFFVGLAQNMRKMILMCQWEISACSFENFTRIFTDMGLCYSFNANGTLISRDAGRSYGLKLTLDTRQFEYLRSMDQYYGAGYRVVVHAPGVPPFLSDKGVSVSAGHHNFLAIDVKKLINAEPSISGCGSKPLKYYQTEYSTEACRMECRTDYLYQKCQCRDLYMPNKDVRVCDPPEFYDCVFPQLRQYFQVSNECDDLCPAACLENLYHVTLSSNPFADNFLSEFSEIMGMNASYWSKNLVHLEIYLTSMTYEVIEKQLGYTILQLFCDVGGAFGLLLGASLLTILEIVDFILCKASDMKVKTKVTTLKT